MIKSLTIAIPKNIVDRSHLKSEALDNFERVTGIKKTRRFEYGTGRAISESLDMIPRDKLNNIDAVIVVTQSPDRLSPCMAVDVHRKLGLKSDMPCFDINNSCNGWLTGLYVAGQLQRKTLLICADQIRFKKPLPLDASDREKNASEIESLIFSDSVSITVVPAFFNPGVEFMTDGDGSDKLYCGLDGTMCMDGAYVTEFVATKIPPAIAAFEKSDGVNTQLLVPHQPNLTLLKLIEFRSGFKDKCLYSVEEYGNMSLNSIPITIAYNEERCLKKGLLMCGFGAGMLATLMKFKWTEKPITKIVEI